MAPTNKAQRRLEARHCHGALIEALGSFLRYRFSAPQLPSSRSSVAALGQLLPAASDEGCWNPEHIFAHSLGHNRMLRVATDFI